jgi:3-hydroxyacyl-CoA dehydrogenase/3a,7a,12a-trihydroxy-5b-cholest-24-enoyl-CoA hydratase
MAELRFDGRVVVVTGAGNGLGKSHALFFASRGAQVVVNDLGGSAFGQGRSSEAAQKVVDEIKAAGGTATANADSVEDGEKIIQCALDTYKRIDVLINNAGILRDVSFHKMTKEDWDLIFRVHVTGAFRCTHAAWPHMREQGYGRILFTTSSAGLYGNFGQANYSAAKLALVGFSNTLALEGEKKNIRSNAVAPVAASRLTETIMSKEMLENLKPEYVTPLFGWLAHEECTTTGRIFEVGAGFFSQLRLERTEGHTFKLGRTISPESLRAQAEKIGDFANATHPANITEALGPVLSNLESKSKGGNEFIDLDQALGYQMPETTSSYAEHDLSLYALGVGAGRNPTDKADLHYLYEGNGDGFWALPTYGVLPALNSFFKAMAEGQGAPGMNYGLDRVLHGEQDLELLRPLPSNATLTHRAKVADIFDKGKNAIVVTHVDSYDSKTGELLAKNDISIVVRGAGGWGGERGPSSDVNVPPERAPDFTVIEKTHENQALLYRLSGDWNPLHVDPEFATMFGFDRPILHGLCTYGFVARAVINSVAKGDPRTFKRFKVRFAESVFPGETIKTELWKVGEHQVVVRATIVERNKVCLSNALMEFYPEIPKPRGKEAAKVAAPAVAAPAPASGGAVSTAQVFDAIGQYVAATPELVKQVNMVYQFAIKSPDSAWVLDLKKGAVRSGAVDKADCTLSLTEADWLDMVSGKADAMKLFQGGKLKITGNVMASQKLDFLKKLDRSALASSSAAAPAQATAAPTPAPAAALATPKLLAALRDRLAKNPKLAAEVDAVIAFTVKDAGVSFTATLTGTPSITDGVTPTAATKVTLDDETFVALSTGTPSVRELFQHGRLRVDGALGPVHRLGFLKQLV